jgi:hypothetical protein
MALPCLSAHKTYDNEPHILNSTTNRDDFHGTNFPYFILVILNDLERSHHSAGSSGGDGPRLQGHVRLLDRLLNLDFCSTLV